MKPKANWIKCDAVTAGGRPYFWFLRHEDVKYWVVWDRIRNVWSVEREDERLGSFVSSAKGRRFVEDLISE